jgi:putative aminophosphonate oxidoreductase
MNRCFWLKEALADDKDVAPPVSGALTADVCIVGGGYTGLWTAIRLKQARPDLDVVIVERDICGGGASGRNGGFAISWWSKYLTLAKLCGEDEAVRVARMSEDAVREIGTFCDAHGIDAHYRCDGWLWTATSKPQVGVWAETVDALEQRQLRPFVDLEDAEVTRRAGSARHIGGVFEHVAATVQPARLARGLRRVALEMGVRVFEHSALVALERTTPPRVRTKDGTVTAGKVVIAMNAWASMFPEIRRATVVVGSDIVATEPIPDRLDRIGWTDGMGISDSRAAVHYYRTTKDGRLVFGKGGAGDLAFGGHVGKTFEGMSAHAASVERWMKYLYPDFDDVPCATSWVGPIDRSKSGLPSFGNLGGHPDILYGVGYSGNGVGPSVVGGRILASLALGLEDEWSNCGLVRPLTWDFPPEPFRYVGGKIVQKAVLMSDAAEDRGRAPNLVLRKLTALAPPGVSQPAAAIDSVDE